LEKIAHIGTGNFHEKNANLYGDFGLLTADPVITKEVEQLFSFFSNHYERPVFKQLMVSPYTTRSRCEQLISREIANAKKGGEAWMIVKMNNLVDPGMILRLYAASRAGVRVELIVRGICTLLPGVKGMSENIRVRSIIGRYLEHSRILVFAGNGEPEYFLSSADWMSRNLDRRVEVTVPIKDARLKKQLQRFIDLQLQDNAKARKIDGNMLNRYVPFLNGAERVDSQEAMYRIYTDSLRDT
jgi:polyphosphate kinase